MSEPWFIRDARQLDELEAMLRERFPALHAFIEDDRCFVRGTLALAEAGQVFDRYAIEIMIPDDYPARPPRVWETAGRIPRVADRHTFLDGALCLGTPIDLWIKLGGDVNRRPTLTPDRTAMLTPSVRDRVACRGRSCGAIAEQWRAWQAARAIRPYS